MSELMKGRTWHERKHKVQYPVLVEPKIDEIRCHVKVGKVYDCGHEYLDPTKVEFLSYAGKPLANMQRFAKKFGHVAVDLNIAEFDCGFEVNANFNDSYRWVRSTNGLPEDLREAGYCFHLYDLPLLGNVSYNTRLGARGVVARHLRLQNLICGEPEGVLCHSAEEVEAAYSGYRERGCEGAMVKSLTHLYQRGKRIDGWLKMKPEDDSDGIITALVEAVCGKDQPELGLRVGDKLGRIGSVLVQCEDGSTAQPHGIPHELGRDMFLHPEKYLNEWCEFKFMERDRQGGYRHPTFHRIREAKQ